MSAPRSYYARPPAGYMELRPRRVALLLTLAAVSAVGGYLAGHSMGSSEAAPAPGARAAAHRSALAQRLTPAAAIGDLSIPAPPPPVQTTPTTTATTPLQTTPSAPAQSAPQQSAPAPTATPTPTPTPTPAPSGGGGGSFDDSG